ncbi:MAG: Crp/Fnr family transcriptional regulator [Tepidisphaeraceae bacterium]
MSEPVEIASTITHFLRESSLGASQLSFADKQVIFRPSDPAINFFIIDSGQVRVFQSVPGDGLRLLTILGADECFGFSALGKMPVYDKLTMSVGNTVLRAIPADRLRQALLARGDLTMQFVESMARHLFDAWSERSSFAFQDCRLRVIRTLLRFRNSPAARLVPGGVELRITHAQLAQAVGAARETVTLCLIQLRNENLVHTSRNRVTFCPQDLLAIDPQADSLPELAMAM